MFTVCADAKRTNTVVLFFLSLLFLLIPAAHGQSGELSGRVWLDRDGSGTQGPGELGMTGVTVDLLDFFGTPLEATTTDGNGDYAFTALSSGDYIVRIDAASVPGGTVQTYDPDLTFDGETTVNLGIDQVLGGLDFGYQGTGTLAGLVFYDQDGDGIVDPEDYGLSYPLVTITDSAARVVASLISSFDGTYSFNGFPADTYTVSVDLSSSSYNPVSDPDGLADNQTTVDLNAGESRTDLNFGYNSEGVLGDRVWLDLDSDGFQDAGEPGLAGVTVELLEYLGTVIDTFTTTADGFYQFNSLSPSVYTVRVDTSTLPIGVNPTADYDGFLDHESQYSLVTAEVFDGLDFGYAGTASAGDLVFSDLDADGFQGVGENGLAGVTLELTDTATGEVASTVTDAAGLYTFGGLPVGSWLLRVDTQTLPAGANLVTDPDGTLDNETLFTTQNGVAITDLDFGYNGNGSIGDNVFLDLNEDGFQDPGDTGLEGVQVQLLDQFGTPLGTATTNASGFYSFANLAAGDYTVRVLTETLPPVAVQTYDLDGFFDHETTLTLATGEVRTDADFGYSADGGIDARLWEDLNGDGIEDFGEPPIYNVRVDLLDDVGATVDFQFTDFNGYVSFFDLPAGDYRIAVDETTLPPAYAPTFDSDGIVTPHTIDVTIGAGEFHFGSNFGYSGPGSITAHIWDDFNGDGIEDLGESQMINITVALLDDQGMTVDVQATDTIGYVTFFNLSAGDYRLVVDDTTLPPNYTPTFDSDGLTTLHTIDVTIAAGEHHFDSAFGYIGPGSITAHIWEDLNGDGIEEIGVEPRMSNVTVALQDSQGMTVDVQVTDTSGSVTFFDLLAGDYRLVVDDVTLPPNYTQTFDSDGLSTPHTVDVSIVAGEHHFGSAFAYIAPGSITAYIWEDLNGDGIEDVGIEPRMSNVTVALQDSQGMTVDVQVSDTSGSVTFFDLLEGDYRLVVDDVTLPPNYTQTFDSDGLSTPHTVDVSIVAGEHHFGSAFAYIGPGTITAHIWEDLNGDGIEDVGTEPRMSNVTVALQDSQGMTVDVQVTDTSGSVTFFDLLAGDYRLVVDDVTLPPNYTQTFDSDGLSTPHTVDVSIVAGEDHFGSAFAYIGPGTITAHIWEDLNGDGIEDEGTEPRMENVTVALQDDQGMTVDVQITDTSGSVTFFDLLAGDYRLVVDDVTLPPNYTQTFDSDGLSTPHTVDVSIVAGEDHFGSAFAYIGPGTITAHIWEDLNGDGIEDEGIEPRMENVTVALQDDQGMTVDVQITDTSGSVTFFDLLAGDYRLVVDDVTLPPNYTQTFDSDGLSTPHTVDVSIVAGEDHFGSTFAYIGPGTITAYIWDDLNGDGIEDVGTEPRMSNVTVALQDGQGMTVDVQVTDPNGSVTFFDLLAGDYRIVVDDVTLPPNYTQTFDSDGLATPHTIDVTIAAGEDHFGSAFAYIGPGSISARLWEDVNGNGLDDGEPSLPGVNVSLQDSQGMTIDVQPTDSGGNVTFFDLLAGDYRIVVDDATLPFPMTPTFDSDGVITPHTIDLTIVAGEDSTGATFGYTNNTPSATITSPADGATVNEGSAVSFTGTASDPEDGDLAANLSWTSSLDGALGTGGSVNATLSVGTHTITASVTDSGGLPASDVITVTVNGAPSVSITAPADGTTVNDGTAITFIGSASDTEDGDLTANVTWTSSLDGALGTGGSTNATLSVGTHTITASVTDSGGLPASDVITVTVNGGPSVSITAPADGTTVNDGTAITFIGSASDTEDGDLTANISWTSSLDGALGTGGSTNATLSVGVHTITASVTDSGGLPASDVITVTVNGGPSVSITAPADGTTVNDGTAITFIGSASDTEDGDLTANISWTSSLDGALGTGGSTNATLSVGVHTITASVTDSGGLPASDAITITINGGPSVSITGPADGTTVNDGTAITFTGSASDTEDGDLTANVTWTSSIDGALGTGGSTNATLSVGTHTITASVTDSGGLPASDVITVTVNGGPSVSITAPADGTSINDGTAITFTGSASDTEDGDLTANVTWTSSIDGALGTGGSTNATLSVGTHTITASVTDSGGLPASDVITVTVNGGPSVSITAPADGTSINDGTAITFTGSASDTEDGDLTANISWTSSLDGALGTGGSVNATLSVGTHTIAASVTDSGGLPASDVITVTVNGGPSVSITAPADGTSVNDGTAITFTGSASDTEDGDLTANISWTSSLDGALGTGGSTNATLSVGVHTITASVTDSGGLPASDAITITVNGGPSVSITGPADGTSVNDGTAIAFTGSASDTEDGDLTANISWTSSLDGALGTGGSVNATLSVGTHTITASVTDSGGLPASDVITVTVNGGPSVSITAPADGTTVNDGTAITFIGSASDTEDGDLTANISWTSSLDGALGTGGSTNATLSVGTHTITASVTDSGGLPASDVITVTVNGGPSVSITAPADGTSVNDGTAIAFTGTASDTEDGDLTANISWTSSLDGALGTGGSVNATLSVGTHTITASVTDSGGLPASDVITVTVNGGPAVSITAPADGTSVNDGTAIAFTGTASDTEDGDLTANLSWTSSLDGALGTGGSVNATLSVGSHTITASVTDSGGLPASDAITVTVNGGPSVSITAPADGTAVTVGTAINFTGTAVDGEDGDLTATISWTSSIDGALGTGGSVNATLSLGTHTITATVTDSGGLPAADAITVDVNPEPVTVTFTSIGAEDGWVRESNETSDVGGTSNSGGRGARPIRPGDATSDRQYKSILSFDTSSIPDGATIVEARFRLTRGTGQGTSPFNGGFGQCLIDVNTGGFSGSNALQSSDFQAAATAVAAAVMPDAPNQGDISEGVLNAAGLAAINVTGRTQVRIYFEIDDNDDGGNDNAGFYSGDNSNASRHPQLEITYQE